MTKTNIDWSSKNIWFLSFTMFVLRNTHVITTNGLTLEKDGILWTLEQFKTWARNQNVNKIPDEIMLEFMSKCTDDIGCILRPQETCLICEKNS